MSEPRRVLVIGGVAAGMSAASQARRRDPEARVVVFERGAEISYGACGMPYNLADRERKMDDLIVLSAEDARAERGIELHLRHLVEEIDVNASSLKVRDLGTDEVRREPFDALVLSTGARAQKLRLPGFDLPGVVSLRTLDDGRTLDELMGSRPRRVTVVGAGYIGMEMAHVFTELGLEVTVVEREPQVLPGWHSSTVGMVTETLTQNGVRVMTSASVEGAEPAAPESAKSAKSTNGTGRVGALLVGGERLETDLVLVATGVRPEVELASAAGLRIGSSGAIWVNQYLQTSSSCIWAAGDCAEAYHRLLRKNAWIPLGTTANKQGRIAGANATGARERFRGIVGTAGFMLFDLEVARTGLSEELARAEGFEPVSVTVRQRSRAHSYPGGSPIQVTLVADRPTGILLGAEVCGREGAALRINVLATAMTLPMNVADLQGLDLVYAPPFAPVWDPILVAANQLIKKTGRKA